MCNWERKRERERERSRETQKPTPISQNTSRDVTRGIFKALKIESQNHNRFFNFFFSIILISDLDLKSFHHPVGMQIKLSKEDRMKVKCCHYIRSIAALRHWQMLICIISVHLLLFHSDIIWKLWLWLQNVHIFFPP